MNRLSELPFNTTFLEGKKNRNHTPLQPLISINPAHPNSTSSSWKNKPIDKGHQEHDFQPTHQARCVFSTQAGEEIKLE
jgi:hypothetical protein